jgi:quercetin dioxygenase-like cupin family protein
MSETSHSHEPRTPGAMRGGPGEYLFHLDALAEVMGGPEYSPVYGPVVEGDRMICARMTAPAGKGADPHHHPNEQWVYVLEGELEMTIDGVVCRAGPGDLVYIPANTVHSFANRGAGDGVFFTVKDASHGLHGIKEE